MAVVIGVVIATGHIAHTGAAGIGAGVVGIGPDPMPGDLGTAIGDHATVITGLGVTATIAPIVTIAHTGGRASASDSGAAHGLGSGSDAGRYFE